MVSEKYKQLEDGQEIKNYKELCTILGEPIASGNSKISQLERFERYFEYHKEGNKFIIDNVYEEPLYNIDKKIVYTHLIQQLVLNNLAKEYKEGNRTVILSSSKLFETLAMVNGNYNEGKLYKNKLANELCIDVECINDFYSITNKKLKKTLDTALNSLRNKIIIDYEMITMMNISNGKNMFYNRHMTDEEFEYYNCISKMIAEEMEPNNSLQNILLSGRWNEYSNKVIDKMSIQTGLDIRFIYKAYKIVFNEYVVKELNKINEYILENEHEIKKMLNSEIVNGYKNSYTDRYWKWLDKYLGYDELDIIGMRSEKYKELEMKTGRYYADNGCLLVDYTIKL